MKYRLFYLRYYRTNSGAKIVGNLFIWKENLIFTQADRILRMCYKDSQ